VRSPVVASLLAVAATAAVARADGMTQVAPSDVSFAPGDVYAVPRGDSPAYGPANAPITVVAWSDYACAYCAVVQDTLDRLDRLYPGLIRWVNRAMPVEDDTIATEAALAAAAQGQFRAMHDRLYAVRGRVDRVQVELVARELGLDMLRFRADLDAGTYRKAIAADLADASALGITGTPMFFINGRAVFGNQPLAVFADVVDQALARAKEVAATHPADLYAALVAHGKPAADAHGEVSNQPVMLSPRSVYRVGLGLPNHAIGKDDALVTIVEWSDFACPFCAKQAPVLAKLRAKYGDDLRVVYRDFPVRFHPESTIAAEAGAAAAAQGKFWAFHDQVFAHFGLLSRADLERYAVAAGLDLAPFRAALDDRRYHDAVIAEGAAAAAFGVEGTPTLFINGRPYVGMRDEANLDQLVSLYVDLEKQMLARGVPRNMLYALAMAVGHGEDLADPANVPEPTRIELRDDARTRAVDAACRRRDPARAAELAAPLAGDAKQRAASVCASEGIDLP
jgi:protein-disulfide isomerase